MSSRGRTSWDARHRKGRLIAMSASMAALVTIPRPALAHGLGGLNNLPAPLSYFVAGMATVLILGFAILTAHWPTPRWQEEPIVKRIAVPGWSGIVITLQGLGVGGLILVVVAGLFGVPSSVRNSGPSLVWVGFWLMVPFVAALVGDLYRLLNPWRWTMSVARIGVADTDRPTDSLGVWPATVAFFGFVWFELIYPNPAHPRHLAIAAIAYTFFLLGIAELRGHHSAIAQWEAFTTYNRVISAIAPIDLDPHLGPGWRGWLRGLPALPVPPGLTAFVVTVIGGVAFHAMSAGSWYRTSLGPVGESLLGSTLLLLLCVGLVAGAFWLVCRHVVRQQSGTQSTGKVITEFTHVLVPVAFALVFAHYFSVVVFEGQLLLNTLSDPLGLGWDLFGRARRSVDFTVISPTAVWTIQVLTIAVGHGVALILAHDRSLAFGGTGQDRSRYGFLLFLILSAGVALTLLATG